ncbi:hypothetical protein CC80DRAFT_499681 [Byssothecium circinans]|uniref:Uncharacterized protein n=1 Tax=Byssothecium circinans TaxID=147558 RepID=A0A6A5UDA1_9PLEO|nr:hypothetical protein CC80DRAFT_499681 [Byssothecium circinans]
MIIVAVAGWTSPGLGRSILEVLAGKPDRLRPIVLSRKSSTTPKWLEDMDTEVKKVGLTEETSLVEALRGVHTASTQLNVCLRAAVQRFTPAEFGAGSLAEPDFDVLRPQIKAVDACREAKKEKPEFEYAGCV